MTLPSRVGFAQTVSFGPATNFPVGSAPYGSAMGDFNEDGKLDLAVTNLGYGDDTVSILLGTGTGSFGTSMNYPVDSDPYVDAPFAVATGDLDGDGHLDLATANVSGGISVLFGDGAGSFGTGVNFDAGPLPNSVAMGDLNSDGFLDLVFANGDSLAPNSNTVSVLLNDGTGYFGSAPATYLPFAGGSSPYSVTIGDLNGDNLLDLAVALMGINKVSILLGTVTGSFGTATNFDVGTEPISVAIGDLNGDGILDLAVANQGSDNVSVLLGDGTGSFGVTTNFGVGNGPYSVAIGDLNFDGREDLAVSNGDTDDNVSILLKDGAGSFGTAMNFDVGTAPATLAVGDLNGDMKLDLAVVNWGSDNVSVLINTTVPSATAYDAQGRPIYLVVPQGVGINNFQWINPATLSNPPSGSFPFGLVSFKLQVPQPGDTVTVAVTFQGSVDQGSTYYKYDPAGPTNQWCPFQITNNWWCHFPFGSDNGDATITLTLTDDGVGDHDPTDGVIEDPGGPAIGVDSQISSAPSGDQRYPWVDFNETTGEYLAVWQDKRNGTFDDIYGVRLDVNGNRIGSDFAISLNPKHQQRALVKSGGGGYLVVWQELKDYAASGSDIYGAWVDGSGNVGAQMAICACPGDQWLPRVGYDPASNRFLVAFLYWNGSNFDLWGAVIPAGGTERSASPFAMVSVTGDQRAPQLGYDWENGWYYLAWNDRRGGQYDIYGSRVSAAGSLMDGTGLVLGGASGNQFRPTVTDRRPAAGINNHLVAWNDYRSSGSEADVYGVYVDGSGAVVGNEIPISLSVGDAVHVVADVDWIRLKKSLVGWVENLNGTDYDVYRAEVDQSGSVAGYYAVAGSATGASDEQRAQVVVYATDGTTDYGFLTIWMDRRNGVDYDIWGIKSFP